MARSRRDGFSLLEIVITMSILGFGLLTLAAMQLYALEGGSRGRHTTQAAAIAQTRMEMLQRSRWTNLAPTAGWTAPVTVQNVVQTDGTENEQSYEVRWRIADVTADFTRNIDVRVTWTEPDRPTRSVTLSSMRFNYENL